MTYAEWLDSLAETARSHELSYEAAAVRRLADDDRGRAAREIVRRVAEGDVLAFETAGELGLTDAIPHLDRHRGGANAWARAAAARALFHLRGDPIAGAGGGEARGLDAWTLKTSDRPEAIPALFAFLTDEAVQPRVHSAEGLVEKLGLAKLAEPRGSPLRRMMLAQCARVPTLWPLGAAELRDALWSVYQGASPAAAGLVHQPSPDPGAVDRFWASCTGWQPFDVGLIERMSPHDRAWAETVLVSRLAAGDTNALAALRALDVPGWRAHVRAAVPLVASNSQVITAYEAALRA